MSLRCLLATVLYALAPSALAGGSPENILVLVDPTRPDAKHVANYYRDARDIPERNFLYLDPLAADYQSFVDLNLDALFGKLAHDGIDDHIDYVVLAPADSFYIDAADLITDGCSPVRRFSASALYTMAFLADEILTAALDVMHQNRYYRGGVNVRPLDSNLAYLNGLPSTDADARHYFCGAMLGYTGERGNTVDEILAMIDRSVAVDGTRPAGTIYYMETTDVNRSGPRDAEYPTAVARVIQFGGAAEHLMDVLPLGRHDCLGIMTGWASPNVDGGDFTILPGAFCDHLTSFAARFDASSQTKLSRWIVKGASGSWGAVEEPCNYPGKFPHARMHVYYVQGVSLGEAALRSAQFTPFQLLLYGDPLTRPFAYLPSVQVVGALRGPVSGLVTLTPSGSTANPEGALAGFDLLIDGVLHGSVGVGGQFAIDTAALPDGWHDLRVLGFDDTDGKATGRWVGSLVTDNQGRSANLGIVPVGGNLATSFAFTTSTVGAGAAETRVIQNGRVVAAAPGGAATLNVYGDTLGAGPVWVQAETLFSDGRCVRSAPQLLNISTEVGAPAAAAPVAFSYTRRLSSTAPVLIELPATFDDGSAPLVYEVVSGPSQGVIPAGQSGPHRLLRPDSSASGTDSIQFRVTGAAAPSNTATVTLIYSAGCSGDLNGDSQVDIVDLSLLLANFGTVGGAQQEDGDINGDGNVDLTDLALLLGVFGTSCA